MTPSLDPVEHALLHRLVPRLAEMGRQVCPQTSDTSNLATTNIGPIRAYDTSSTKAGRPHSNTACPTS